MAGPNERPDDEWGVGQRDDGSIASYTPEEAARLKGKRDAEEAAFDAAFDADDDLSDLDDPLPQEGQA